ncbi:MFS transporter [bacterium]|nr:MFS transporter [bacterium]
MAIGSRSYLQLLRDNRQFRRLYIAQLISFGGDWFLLVPLMGLLYDLTGSEVATAAVLVAQSLPTVFASPVAGVIADRLSRKAIMIIADLARATIVLGLLFVDNLASPALAFGLLALISVGSSFFFPASNGALPNLVEPEDLPTATVLLGAAWGTMAAVGAALGGVFAAAINRDAAFAIDSVSFLVSAVLIARVTGRFRAEETGDGASMSILSSIGEAVSYARAHPQVAALLTSKSGFALVAGAISLFPLVSIEVFGAGDAGTGLLFGARGLGALIGPLMVKRLFGHSDRLLISSIGYAVALWGVGYILFSTAPGLGLAALAVFAAHLGGGVEWSISTYGLQRLVPDDVRGRIFSFDYAAFTLTMSASFVAAGLLAGTIGIQSVIALSGGLGVAAGLIWSAATKRLWDGLDDPPAEKA